MSPLIKYYVRIQSEEGREVGGREEGREFERREGQKEYETETKGGKKGKKEERTRKG